MKNLKKINNNPIAAKHLKSAFIRKGKKQKVKVSVLDVFKVQSVFFFVHESSSLDGFYSVSEYKSGALFYDGAKGVEEAGREAVKRLLMQYHDDQDLLYSIMKTCKKFGVANKRKLV